MPDKRTELLDRMYDEMPLLRRTVDKELRSIVDRGRTLDKSVSFLAYLLDGFELGSEEERFAAVEEFLETRLGWR